MKKVALELELIGNCVPISMQLVSKVEVIVWIQIVLDRILFWYFF